MYNEKNNVYALNLKNEIIHVSDASSGRKGYYCLGCKRELQAVISKKTNRIDYFRHDSKDVVNRSHCVYSDETYRHKLAKEILQRIKRIKVPAVYKYPPKSREGLANLLEESKFVEADHVGIEMTFYEDESGAIHLGSNPEVENRFLIVRPDVVFFNSNNDPILFIELVATHGIKNDKTIKLKRLGIDTIQVRVPKDSPDIIERNFQVTDKTKWVYNNVEERTEYVHVASSNTEGVSPIDEIQRKLQEESFACRAAEIGNLIRSIRRCLESEPYRESESELTNEISRVTRNTDNYQSRLDKLRDDCRNRVQIRYKGQIDDIIKCISQIERETGQIDQRYRNLEGRYFRKAKEIANKDYELGHRIRTGIEENNSSGESIEERKRQIISDRERTVRDFESRKNEIGRNQSDLLNNIEREKVRIDEIIESRTTIPTKFEGLEKSVRDEHKKHENREVEEIQSLSRDEDSESEIFGESENRIRKEFERLQHESLESIKTRNGSGNNELSRRINYLLQTRRRLLDFEKDYITYKRNREAWDSFNKGTYKDWND